MRVTGINNYRCVSSIRYPNRAVSFGKIPAADKLKEFTENKKCKKLQTMGISDIYAQRLARLPKKQYDTAKILYNTGVFEECIEDIVNIDEKKFPQVLELIENHVIDENLLPLANLDKPLYDRIIALKKHGIDTDILKLFADLDSEQYKKALQYLREGCYPIEAAYMAQLSDKQKETAKQLLEKNINIEEASRIAVLNKKEQQRCRHLLSKGVTAEEVCSISTLKDNEYERVDELINLNIGDENITEFAALSDDEYKNALNLLKQNVISQFIPNIVCIENGKSNNPEYEEYISKGYSKSCSYAIYLLSEEEIDFLNLMIKKYPEIKEILKDEYDINMITRQDTNENEVTFAKEMRAKNGTKTTLFKIYTENGISSFSRMEEHSNHSTSSKTIGNSNIYKIKYDKGGGIREMTIFLQNRTTGEVENVVQVKASTVLKGVFTSKIYNISDFKTGFDEECIDKNIEDCVNSEGTEISSVTENPDGSVEYKEHFTVNDCNVKRYYIEKRDENGNLEYSYYSYNIDDENKKPLMNISREYKKQNDGSVLNTINGVEYNIKFDEKNKTAVVSDGKRTKTLNFRNKLSFYHQNKLWNYLKTLPADVLVSLDKNIEQWNYCRGIDSMADGYGRILSSDSSGTIYHELGHFEDYNHNYVSEREDFKKIYTKETAEFMNKMPFNEQSFIQYFSPRADLNEANGLRETTAETNILLNTYGNSTDELKTRTQILAGYFPRTIAKIAEMLDKTSTKSILE